MHSNIVYINTSKTYIHTQVQEPCCVLSTLHKTEHRSGDEVIASGRSEVFTCTGIISAHFLYQADSHLLSPAEERMQ